MGMGRSSLAFSTLLLLSFVLGCGEESKKEEVTVYGTLKTSSPETQSFSLTKASCVSNPSSGSFTATLSGERNTQLKVSIKGFSTKNSTYTCTQASDNADGDVGQLFDACMVEFSIPDAKSGLNTYSMHRSSESVKDFSYQGECRVESEYSNGNSTLTINCAGLIQTQYQSAPRNPIDPAVTASLEGSKFSCATGTAR